VSIHCTRIYIYGAAVINLRSKITYGPQMLRSVFLRFPLFIHPRPGGRVRGREKTHARLRAPIYTHGDRNGTEGCTYTAHYIRRRRASCRKTENIFAGQKTAAAAEDLRRCERHPSRRRRRIQDQLHRPGRTERSHWSGARTVTPGPHLPTAGIPYTSVAVTTRYPLGGCY